MIEYGVKNTPVILNHGISCEFLAGPSFCVPFDIKRLTMGCIQICKLSLWSTCGRQNNRFYKQVIAGCLISNYIDP